MADSPPWYRTRRGPPIVVGYAVLTLLVLALSTGWGLDWQGASVDVQVPLDVYLYGFLGGMTYAFTSLVARFERGTLGVVRVGIRALAALPLAAGVYLLAGPLGLPTGEDALVAGLAFLVGLYVNVTLKALGGLADRLFGRHRAEDAPATSGRPASGAGRPSAEQDGADDGRSRGVGTVAAGSGDSGA